MTEIGPDERRHRAVLVAGLPRSGSSWAAHALGHTTGTTLVMEPDNDRNHVEAMAAKARLGRYPLLAPGRRAPAYAALWRDALDGADHVDSLRNRWAARLVATTPDKDAELDRVMADPVEPWPWRMRLAASITRVGLPPVPEGGPVVVKSVHCALALEWIADTVRPDEVVVLVRHPANVIGSWRDMGWGVTTFPWNDPSVWARVGPTEGLPPGGAPEAWIDRAAWQFAALAEALLAAASRHGWILLDHEDLLDDPAARLRSTAERLGLDWGAEADAWVAEMDRPGQGYDLARVTAEERERWRGRLPEDDLGRVASVLSRYSSLADRWTLSP